MRALLYKSLVAATVTSMTLSFAHGAESHPLAGHVVSISGTVLLRQDVKNESAAQAKQLKPGDKIFEGDVINTSSDGKAKLLMADRTILDVGSSALFHVNKFDQKSGADRDVELSMMYGSVRANVTKKLDAKGKFRIRTPSATMGVRGTQFIVASGLEGAPVALTPEVKAANVAAAKNGTAPSAAKTEVVVIDGKVEVSQAPKLGARGLANTSPPVALTAGQGIVTDGSMSKADFKPMTLSTEQMGKALEIAKVEDNTFKAAITLEAPKAGESGNNSGAGVHEVLANVVSNDLKPANGGAPQLQPTLNFPGAFSGPTVAAQPNIVAGGFRRVTITIKR